MCVSGFQCRHFGLRCVDAQAAVHFIPALFTDSFSIAPPPASFLYDGNYEPRNRCFIDRRYGSTKADWAVWQRQWPGTAVELRKIQSNQYDAQQIALKLANDPALMALAEQVSSVRYFGSVVLRRN